MTALAAIDIGTNAIRMVISDVDAEGNAVVFKAVREPIRLGREVFATGEVSEDAIFRTVDAFVKFRTLIQEGGVSETRAVATSAVREARNRETLVDRVFDASGIAIEVITAAEEARLIHIAVSHRMDFGDRLAMLIDIGGGSVEVTVATKNDILLTESYKMGSVRLLGTFDEDGEEFNRMVVDHIDAIRHRIEKEIGEREIECCFGTGGSIESLGELRRTLYGRNSSTKLGADELARLVKDLEALSNEQRIEELGLRADRADVIVPAATVLKAIVDRTGVDEIQIPQVGLKEGVLLDLAMRVIDAGLPADGEI